MPKFILNKLVRDNLVKEFENKNQKATHRSLTHGEHIQALKNKIIEEAKEIPVGSEEGDFISELADVQQALDDLRGLAGVTRDQVLQIQKQKYDKKGGFLQGMYVETLELLDDDEWVDYYRTRPEQFVEIMGDDQAVTPGEYRHYKGNKYRIIGVGKDTETEEDVVIYQPLYESDVAYWVRPYIMFTDTVVVDGKTIKRFERILSSNE